MEIQKSPVDKWITAPINNFISKSTTGGIVLFLAAVIAIFFANSPWAEWYHHLWQNKIGIAFNDDFKLNFTLHHWINDGLMSIFFFVVGLELKRELTNGELSSPRKAMLPILAAIGGMIVPAVFYTLFNAGTDAAHGWGIPMATDIAFALGVLYILGDQVPSSLKVFLAALAIADDLGAVIVIALFYTSEISMFHLGLGFAFFGLLLLANKLGVKNVLFYAIVGIGGIWLAFLMSGVHATIAAVLAAFAIPTNAKVNETYFSKKISELKEKFFNVDPQNEKENLTDDQIHTIEEIRDLSKNALPPSQRLEHALHGFVSFIIMPIFALANAAIAINFGDGSGISNVTLGVAIGLLFGKVIGVAGFTALLIKLKVAPMPNGMNYINLLGIGFLAAIGFTMSLFVTELAFDVNLHPELPGQAKMGILIASLLGGIIGYVILSKSKK